MEISSGKNRIKDKPKKEEQSTTDNGMTDSDILDQSTAKESGCEQTVTGYCRALLG